MMLNRSEETAAWSVENSISAVREGSISAVGQLLDHYRDYLLRVANDELSSHLAVKVAPSDLVQETCLQATKDFCQFKGATEPELRAWLRQILVNNLLDLQRRYYGTQKRGAANEISFFANSNERPVDVASVGPSPSSILASEEEMDSLEQSIAKLPEDYRQVVQMRNFDGCSFEEIGSKLGRSAEAVRKVWVRAVQKLSDDLKTPGDSGGAP